MSKNTTLGKVAFQRCDNHSEKNVEIVEKVAEHFKVHRSYFKGIFNLIVLSRKWYPENGEYNFRAFENWKIKFTVGNYIDDKTEIAGIIEEGFKNCIDSKDFHTLRGLLFEAMLLGLYGGKSIIAEDSFNFGWGSQVIVINNRKIETVDYTCKLKKNHNCKSRLTIDFAHWDNDTNSGKFFECKVSPSSFTCKEDNYMYTLQGLIEQIGGHGKYYLAAPHPARKFDYTCELSKNVEIFGTESFEEYYTVK